VRKEGFDIESAMAQQYGYGPYAYGQYGYGGYPQGQPGAPGQYG
jgi:hypothetical protein